MRYPSQQPRLISALREQREFENQMVNGRNKGRKSAVKSRSRGNGSRGVGAVKTSYAHNSIAQQVGCYNRVRPGSTPGSLVVEGRDLISTIRTTATTLAGVRFEALPLNPTAYPETRLAAYAKMFERFKFVKVKCSWVPCVPSTSAGSMLFAYEADCEDNLPTEDDAGLQQMYSWPGTTASSVWSPLQFAPPMTAREALWTGLGKDVRLSTQGRIYAACANDIDRTGALGTLFMEYTVELSVPQLEGDDDGLVMYNSVTENGNWLCDAWDMLTSAGKPISHSGDNPLVKTPNGNYGWFLKRGVHIVIRACFNGVTGGAGALVNSVLTDVGDTVSDLKNLYVATSGISNTPQQLTEVIKVKSEQGAYLTMPPPSQKMNGGVFEIKSLRFNVMSGKAAMAYLNKKTSGVPYPLSEQLIDHSTWVTDLDPNITVVNGSETMLFALITDGTIDDLNVPALGLTFPLLVYQGVIDAGTKIEDPGTSVFKVTGGSLQASFGLVDPHLSAVPDIVDNVTITNFVAYGVTFAP